MPETNLTQIPPNLMASNILSNVWDMKVTFMNGFQQVCTRHFFYFFTCTKTLKFRHQNGMVKLLQHKFYVLMSNVDQILLKTDGLKSNCLTINVKKHSVPPFSRPDMMGICKNTVWYRKCDVKMCTANVQIDVHYQICLTMTSTHHGFEARRCNTIWHRKTQICMKN